MPTLSTATIVIDSDSQAKEFAMYDLKKVDEKGAVVSGPLFLEVGEQILLQIVVAKAQMRLNAQVQAVVTDTEQMTLRFIDLNPDDKKRLQAHAF